jgi:hypothetical protein
MTPAVFGLTYAPFVSFPMPTVSVAHHALRLSVLLIVMLGAFGFSQPSIVA